MIYHTYDKSIEVREECNNNKNQETFTENSNERQNQISNVVNANETRIECVSDLYSGVKLELINNNNNKSGKSMRTNLNYNNKDCKSRVIEIRHEYKCKILPGSSEQNSLISESFVKRTKQHVKQNHMIDSTCVTTIDNTHTRSSQITQILGTTLNVKRGTNNIRRSTKVLRKFGPYINF